MTPLKLEKMYAWLLNREFDKWYCLGSHEHVDCFKQLFDEDLPEMKNFSLSEDHKQVIRHTLIDFTSLKSVKHEDIVLEMQKIESKIHRTKKTKTKKSAIQNSYPVLYAKDVLKDYVY